jgi:hypothetical protein
MKGVFQSFVSKNNISLRGGTCYLVKTCSVSLVITLLLVGLQFIPLPFQQYFETDVHRLGWPFWYDRQIPLAFGNPIPKLIWNSGWWGINVKAIAGNAIFCAIIFVCLLSIGTRTKGFRRLFVMDLMGLTLMVAICVNFRSQLSHGVHQCGAALDSPEDAAESLWSSSLLLTSAVTICFGIYSLICTSWPCKRIDTRSMDRSGGSAVS